MMKLDEMNDQKEGIKHVFLSVDGVQVAKEGLWVIHNHYIKMVVDSKESLGKIAEHSYCNLPSEVVSLRLLKDGDYPKDSQDWRIIGLGVLIDNQDSFTIIAEVLPYLPSWKNPYSISEWLEEFGRIASEDHPAFFIAEKSRSLGVVLIHKISDPSQNIGNSLNQICEKIEAIAHAASANLELNARRGTLSTYFSFPPETQSACEQYLLYFGEFLRDLGIDTSIQLKEEAGRVLFSVTPKDRDEALEHIREALDVYIGLPASSFSSEGQEYRLEIQKLGANVLHFKSQIVLAHAMLEAKQATIDTQRERLDYQRRIIEGRILIESKQEQIETQGGKEEFLDGTVALKKYEGKGFDIDLPKLFRMLRDRFTRKQ